MIKFGTGGWRTIIGEDFTKANVQVVAQALADLMKREGVQSQGIVLGYDRRFLSDRAARWFAEVVAGCGIKVHFINKAVPTPLIMFTAKRMKLAYSACITASHNPAEFNGIKIFEREGRDAGEECTAKIEELCKPGHRPGMGWVWFPDGVKKGLIEPFDPMNEYLDHILAQVDIERIKSRKLRVVLDPMFGVSKTALLTILVTGRCEVEIIHDAHDTLFGGRMPSPSAATLHQLKEMVLDKGYDLGIGTDGDADRLGIIDERGNFIHPNDILALLYYYFLQYKGWKGGVVRNIATTHLLNRIAAGYGEQCYEVPVGFKHISSKMEETGALIGGESSGGLTLRGHIMGKDGIFSATLLIEMLAASGKRLGELQKEISDRFGGSFMAEHDCRFDEQDKARLQKLLFEEKKVPDFGIPVQELSYRDGLKVYFKNGGWLIARFSGTEPLLRIFAEMADENAAHGIARQMKAFLGL
jgi:phosphomannomutase